MLQPLSWAWPLSCFHGELNAIVISEICSGRAFIAKQTSHFYTLPATWSLCVAVQLSTMPQAAAWLTPYCH